MEDSRKKCWYCYCTPLTPPPAARVLSQPSSSSSSIPLAPPSAFAFASSSSTPLRYRTLLQRMSTSPKLPANSPSTYSSVEVRRRFMYVSTDTRNPAGEKHFHEKWQAVEGGGGVQLRLYIYYTWKPKPPCSKLEMGCCINRASMRCKDMCTAVVLRRGFGRVHHMHGKKNVLLLPPRKRD